MIWLSGRALSDLSGPWPSAELGAEERAALYGTVAAECQAESVRGDICRQILAALARSPSTVAELEAIHGQDASVRGIIAGLSRHGEIVRVERDRLRWQIIPTRGLVAPSEGIVGKAPGCH